MSARQEKVREALERFYVVTSRGANIAAALAEVEEWEAARVVAEAFLQGTDDAATQLAIRVDAAEAEADRLKAVIAAKDELLVAYRIGSLRKADAALSKLEKLAALAPADRDTA